MGVYAIIENDIVVNTIVADSLEIAKSVTGASEVEECTDNFPSTNCYRNEDGQWRSPKIYNSWIWNSELFFWEPPFGPPIQNKQEYFDEETSTWKELDFTIPESEISSFQVRASENLIQYVWDEDTVSWIESEITDINISDDEEVE
jgi:hypothetical protein